VSGEVLGTVSSDVVGGERIILSPAVPDLAALGAERPGDLAGGGGGLEGEPRSAVVSEGQGETLLRYPLPGTPDETGRRFGSPRGAGTGWVYLRRFRDAGLRESLAARFTAPPSQSLAEREWNLLCHLRSQGVGTPEPLAVGALGSGLFARTSFIATRELSEVVPLLVWAERDIEAGVRRRGLDALGDALMALCRAGVWLPRLGARHLYLSAEEAGVGESIDCSADQIGMLRAGLGEGSGLAVRRSPGVILTGFAGGRILPAIGVEHRVELLERLDADLAHTDRVGGRERRRVVARATLDLPLEERRAVWRSLSFRLRE